MRNKISSANWRIGSDISTRALADRLHTSDIISQTDLNVVEAAKHLHHKLLRKANDDMERIQPQPCESFPAEITRDKRRCPRHGTSKEKPCPRPEALSTKPCSPTETLVEKPCSRPETSEVFRSLSETTVPSREQPERVAGGDFRRQLELTAPLCRPGEWKYEFKVSQPNYEDTELTLH